MSGTDSLVIHLQTVAIELFTLAPIELAFAFTEIVCHTSDIVTLWRLWCQMDGIEIEIYG